MAQLTAGITLEYGAAGVGGIEPTSWTSIPDVNGIPTLISAPNQVDVTTFEHLTNKTYILGLSDPGLLEFDAIMTAELHTAVDAVLAAQEAGTVWFRVVYPTPIAKYISWTGEMATLGNAGEGIDDAVKAKISIVASSDLSWHDVAVSA